MSGLFCWRWGDRASVHRPLGTILPSVESLEDRAEPEGLEGTVLFPSPFGRKMVPE